MGSLIHIKCYGEIDKRKDGTYYCSKCGWKVPDNNVLFAYLDGLVEIPISSGACEI